MSITRRTITQLQSSPAVKPRDANTLRDAMIKAGIITKTVEIKKVERRTEIADRVRLLKGLLHDRLLPETYHRVWDAGKAKNLAVVGDEAYTGLVHALSGPEVVLNGREFLDFGTGLKTHKEVMSIIG